MIRKTKRAAWLGAVAVMGIAFSAYAASDARSPKQLDWQFDGVFGTVDKQSAQRGLQVYREVCASCHGLKRVAFRTLTDLGFSEAEVKAMAAEYTIGGVVDEDGEITTRPALPSDKFPQPYANPQAAKAANNGAYPPDLSLIVKARHDGANYLYSILTGYEEVPQYHCSEMMGDECVAFTPVSAPVADGAEKASDEVYKCVHLLHGEAKDIKTGQKRDIQICDTLADTSYYNPYMPGGKIAMPAPLVSDGQVTYQDNTEATKSQMAKDVTNFLQWAAEPEMEARKHMGIQVILFLIIATFMLWLAKRRIWSKLK